MILIKWREKNTSKEIKTSVEFLRMECKKISDRQCETMRWENNMWFPKKVTSLVISKYVKRCNNTNSLNKKDNKHYKEIHKKKVGKKLCTLFPEGNASKCAWPYEQIRVCFSAFITKTTSHLPTLCPLLQRPPSC